MGVKVVVQKCTKGGRKSVPRGSAKVYNLKVVKLFNTYGKGKKSCEISHHGRSTFLEGTKISVKSY